MKRSTLNSKNPIATKIVDEAMARWPNLPSRALARKIYQSDGAAFPSLEAVRGMVRYRRGAYGNAHRNGIAKADRVEPAKAPDNPLGLPTSDETSYKPHVIDVAKTAVALVLSDIHVPYHSVKALTAAIEDGKRASAEIVILNGDTVDCYQLSRFDKDPRRRDMLGEVQAVKELLDVLRKNFPNAEIVWKDGNHDERLALYLCAKVPEIIRLGLVNWPAILGFADRKITYVSEKRPIKLGKLTIMHGHEFPSGISAPVNAARGLYLRAKDTALAGHWHQSSEHNEPTINEALVTCWSLGCLCELHPLYMPINKWNHGYALVEVQPNGHFRVWNKRIRNGELLN